MPRKRRQLGGIDRLESRRYRARVVDEATGERVSLGTYRTKADAEHALASAISDQSRGRWVRPDGVEDLQHRLVTLLHQPHLHQHDGPPPDLRA